MELKASTIDISLQAVKNARNETDRASKKSSVGGKLARGGALAGLGLGALVFGGLPYMAAKRILHPMWAEENYKTTGGKLELEVDVQPEYVVYDSRDGKQLSGWFVPAPASSPQPWPVVMLAYGYGGYKEQMAGYSKIIHEGGFATFMFDMTGSGLRRGEAVTFGYKERWDMMDAANYLRTRQDIAPDRIGALGISMGAATALLAAEQDTSIKAIVADSSYADLFGMVRPGIAAFVGRRALFLAPFIVRIAETMVGMKADSVRPDEAAASLGDRPLFIIHGDSDSLTDPNSAQRLYDAASGPKELWVVPECGHANAPVVAPDEYKRRVNEFFQKYL